MVSGILCRRSPWVPPVGRLSISHEPLVGCQCAGRMGMVGPCGSPTHRALDRQAKENPWSEALHFFDPRNRLRACVGAPSLGANQRPGGGGGVAWDAQFPWFHSSLCSRRCERPGVARMVCLCRSHNRCPPTHLGSATRLAVGHCGRRRSGGLFAARLKELKADFLPCGSCVPRTVDSRCIYSPR